jgi:formylglycine-generating enzyme required for sulfatase activity
VIALAREPLDPGARVRAADLTYTWLLAAERDHEVDVVRDLEARLAQLDDDGSRSARLAAPARLWVTTTPPGARVLLHVVHLDEGGHRIEGQGEPLELGMPLDLAPGSYVLAASAPGRYSTRLPLLLRRGQAERVQIPLPEATEVPAGFVYVPAGVSLLGAAEPEAVRTAFDAEPQHAVEVPAFLIAVHEVTYGEYLTYLAALPATERTSRRPHSPDVDLTYDRDGVPSLTLRGTTVRRGEMLCRPKRSARRCQDWQRLAIVALSFDAAEAYLTWLGRTGVRGARLCSDREWERAARGADGRLYPHGDALHAGEANFDETYGSDPEQLGVDEVGAFPADRSPFGVLDLAGNVSEWTGSLPLPARRGGYWNDLSLNARAAIRGVASPEVGDPYIGIRACADAPRLP